MELNKEVEMEKGCYNYASVTFINLKYNKCYGSQK
jgi:hypothetical protein